MKFILNNIVTYFELSSQNLFNSDIKNSENTASSNSLLIIQCTSGGRKELISLRPPLLNSFPYDKNPSICWKVVIKRNQMMKIVMIKKLSNQEFQECLIWIPYEFHRVDWIELLVASFLRLLILMFLVGFLISDVGTLAFPGLLNN